MVENRQPTPEGQGSTTPASGRLDGEHDILAELKAELEAELEEERPPEGGPVYQRVGALAFLTIGAVAAFLAYGYGLGSLREPGPGLWPFLVSLLVVVLSAVLLVVGRRLHDAEAFTRSSLLPAGGLLTFVALGFLLPVIGFEIPALLLCAFWLRFLGGESWRSTVVVSVVTVAAFYVLFLYGLRIPLPHLI
jgi:hypothetical protein